jgi:dihydropteroate synthase
MGIDLSFKVPLPKTLVMGIINTTPDSFSDGGKHLDRDVAIRAGLDMLKAGADILDVGAESTRPGSSYVDPEEEISRAIPVIQEICSQAPGAIVSIDTRRRAVAEEAIKAGAKIINDVSGFRHEPALVDLAKETGAPVIVMHMLGEPKTMQVEIKYNTFPGDIIDFFRERIATLESAGIDPDKIVIDPGLGFGKTFDHNLILINRLKDFLPLGKAILMGPSRKAFLGKILDLPVAADRDAGTLAAVTASILNGASIIRVHEVPNSVHVCKVADAIKREHV